MDWPASPWSRAREAERRASAAEERAAFLEQELVWMRGLVMDSRRTEEIALKTGWNVAAQTAFGHIPFPDAPSIPPRDEGRIRDLEEMTAGSGRPRDLAMAEFKRSEMQRLAANPQ